MWHQSAEGERSCLRASFSMIFAAQASVRRGALQLEKILSSRWTGTNGRLLFPWVALLLLGTLSSCGGDDPTGPGDERESEAAILEIATQPSGAVIGQELSRQPVIEIRDEAGALLSDDDSTHVRAELPSELGELHGQTTVQASGGIASFVDLRVSGRVREYALEFSAHTLAPSRSELFSMDPPPGLAPVDTTHIVVGEQDILMVSNNLLLDVLPDTPAGVVDSLIADRDGSIVGSLQLVAAPRHLYQVEVATTSLAELDSMAADLVSDGRVGSAIVRSLLEPEDRTYPGMDNDDLSLEEGFAYRRVRLTPAWWLIDNTRPSTDPIRVGVIDTGLDRGHSEFDAPLEIRGRNLTVGAEDEWFDQDGHGTQVTGIISAANDGAGISGVLGPAAGNYELWVYRVGHILDIPDRLRGTLRCQLESCRVLDGYAVRFAELWATSHDGIDVLNRSIGLEKCESPERIQAFGKWIEALLDHSPSQTVLVQSAGNSGIDAACTRPTDALHPRYLLVAGTDGSDARAIRSNYGDITIAAPYDVLSTDLSTNSPQYRTCSGTSCSSPLVAGAASLLRQLGTPPDEVKRILTETGEAVPTDRGTWRLLDIGAAVKATLDLESLPIYASSGVGTGDPPSDLYMVYPTGEGSDLRIGRIRTASGVSPVITDLARAPDGGLWGVSGEALYRIDRTSGLAAEVGPLGVNNVNALEFYSDGTLYAASHVRTPFASAGSLYRVDLASGTAEEVGGLGSGHGSSGDMALAPDGTLFGSVRTLFGSNYLARIDVVTGQANRVSTTTIGFGNVFGLRFVGDTLFGLTADGDGPGKLITIDTDTGEGTLVRELGFGAFGAASPPDESR